MKERTLEEITTAMVGLDSNTDARKLARSTLKDGVADHIRELIFSGQLRPNQRVDQDELAESLGVSKLPVREAIIALEGEALVHVVPRRGTFVAPLTVDDIRDHYHIYALVLGIAAERAAERLSAEDVATIESLISRMDSTKEVEELERLNFEFHRRINMAGGSHRLLSVVRLLASTIPSRFYEFTTGWSDLAAEEHARIVKALRARDAAEAREAMVDHIRSGGEFAIQLLEESGFWSPETR